MDSVFGQYSEELERVIASLDANEFKKFHKHWQDVGILSSPLPKDDLVIEISIRKMALAISTIPQDVKDRAGRWLDENGYSRSIH